MKLQPRRTVAAQKAVATQLQMRVQSRKGRRGAQPEAPGLGCGGWLTKSVQLRGRSTCKLAEAVVAEAEAEVVVE